MDLDVAAEVARSYLTETADLLRSVADACLDDIVDGETRNAVAFILVDSIDDVFAAAFGFTGGVNTNGRVQAATSRR